MAARDLEVRASQRRPHSNRSKHIFFGLQGELACELYLIGSDLNCAGLPSSIAGAVRF
jgi:hypothetical protein